MSLNDSRLGGGGACAWSMFSAAGMHSQYGLSSLATAEHDQQVGNELIPVGFREFEAAVSQSCYGIFNNFDGPLDNRLAGIDQSHGLLTHQHRLSNFGSVSQIVESHHQHANSRWIDSILQFGHKSLTDNFALFFEARDGGIADS